MKYPRCFYSFKLYLGTSSFDQVDRWIMEVRQERGNEVCIIVVGNKNDLGDKR